MLCNGLGTRRDIVFGETLFLGFVLLAGAVDVGEWRPLISPQLRMFPIQGLEKDGGAELSKDLGTFIT